MHLINSDLFQKKLFLFQTLMNVVERHAMKEDNVKMASMTIRANAMMDLLEKTAKQVSDSMLIESSTIFPMNMYFGRVSFLN